MNIQGDITRYGCKTVFGVEQFDKAGQQFLIRQAIANCVEYEFDELITAIQKWRYQIKKELSVKFIMNLPRF